MSNQQKIREGMKDILSEDLITYSCTHENAPPGIDCGDKCDVGIDDQIAASNPITPMRSGGKKHKKCMDCWNEYIENLVDRLLIKLASQGCVLKKEPDIAKTRQFGQGFMADVIAGCTESLVEG